MIITLCLFALGLTVSLAEEDRKGTLIIGALFRHYDRDGDGKFEEWSRPDIIYFDRNGDGIPDVVKKPGESLGWALEWDADLDGLFDHRRTVFEGDRPEYSPIVKITPWRAPAMFSRDAVIRRVKIKADTPRWRSYIDLTQQGSGK